MPRIYRCVCTRRTFADLLVLARQNGWSLRELAECTGATQQCGRCQPYLRHTLQTGQVVFNYLLPADPPEADEQQAAAPSKQAPQGYSR